MNQKGIVTKSISKMVILALCTIMLTMLCGTFVWAEEDAGQEETGFVTITDHADREVTVPTDPERVIILDILPLPSVLTVFLGSADTILAMEPASMNAAKNGILSELYP